MQWTDFIRAIEQLTGEQALRNVMRGSTSRGR